MNRSRTKKIFAIVAVMLIAACSSDISESPGTFPTQEIAIQELPIATEAETQATNIDSNIEIHEAEQSLGLVGSYTIVDSDQNYCFSEASAINCGQSFVGQDAQYAGLAPSYLENGDGTISDVNTGLMWIQDPGEKTYYDDAIQLLESFSFAGYDDWRLPSIKELYSLALFSGIVPSSITSSSTEDLIPFINTDYFVFLYGDESSGARVIDSQWLTSTIYQSTVMNGQSCFFGFNFADGRIKCYPIDPTVGGSGGYFALFVRGNERYGQNNYEDNGDGTISDLATGLTWAQDDNSSGTIWNEALNYCEALTLGGQDDWRLPNIKELQSIVDYSRSPDSTNSAALDPNFHISAITNEVGQSDYPFFWSSTTLISYSGSVSEATYISFGRGLGYMEEFGGWIDVHGAGSQRSDAKAGASPAQTLGHGPQGDARRSDNYVRCVRAGEAAPSAGDDPASLEINIGSSNVPSGNGGQLDQFTPPQEAINACSGFNTGSACSIGPNSGTCQNIQDQLACVPEGGPPPGSQP